MECKSFITPSPSSGSDTALDIQEFELTPLDKDISRNILREKKTWDTRRNGVQTTSTSWRGPLKVLRLFILVALLPALFIAVPLYLRFYVFSGQLYPIGMSDMRLIDKKVSTTWCQRQLLHSNATFNAFLMASKPNLATELVHVSMSRELSLEDDMKEYWGFYLLQGSSVTVSTCVRWPGASLIMIRGHQHLQECAYIGDDSSEELEEILRANGGKLDNATIRKLIADQPTNRPEDMTRHLSGVRFHEPRPPALQLNSSDQFNLGRSDERDTPDSQMLRKILGQLKFKQEMNKIPKASHVRPSYIIPVPQLVHRYRETNINEEEEKWLSFKDLENPKNDDKLAANGIDTEANHHDASAEEPDRAINIDATNAIHQRQTKTEENIEDNSTNKMIDALKEIDNGDDAAKEQQSSSEIFADVFDKLNSLGSRGKNVLKRLNQKLASEDDTQENTHITRQYPETAHKTSVNRVTSAEDPLNALTDEEIADKKIETLRRLLEEIMEDQNRLKKERKMKNQKEDPVKKRKREILITQNLAKELNEHDEKGNAAIEEGFEADGIADHHVRLNETTLNDMSRSEFWSSFSSSEEALLECDGLILNLPLTPHKSCEASQISANSHDEVSRANTVTYRVPTNGYYFFVFNSENEVQTNYIRVKFDLKKTIYDLSKGTLMECKNSTDHCSIPLAFFSEEKVVFEVPVGDNDSLWNEDFVVVSECEPRTAIYVVCVIAVPLLIVIMAFQ